MRLAGLLRGYADRLSDSFLVATEKAVRVARRRS